MDEKKKQKRRSLAAARLYWAITDALERHDLNTGDRPVSVDELLDALKDDNMEAAR